MQSEAPVQLTPVPPKPVVKQQQRRQCSDAEEEVQRLARARADDQARRIPWQTLLQSRTGYIDWMEFYYWVRSITETLGHISEPLKEALASRCPGFLEAEAQYQNRQIEGAHTFPLRLLVWIESHFFARAKAEGWLDAVTFYAARDPRYLHANAYWSECKERWRKEKPPSYPNLEQWREAAIHSELERNLRPELKERWAAFHRANPDRLQDAVSRYLDWEAFAYWTRSPLESGASLPRIVADALAHRCPGFIEQEAVAGRKDPPKLPRSWFRLMEWITNHFFADAKTEHWLDAILISAENHPRSIRTTDYWMHWDEIWGPNNPEPYLSFSEWRARADSYTDLEPG